MDLFGEVELESTEKRKMSAGSQVKNGKAFEYAIAKTYAAFLMDQGLDVVLIENAAMKVALGFYQEFSTDAQRKFDNAAYQTIDTMIKIEPKLVCQTSAKDILHIFLNEDSDGQSGDVRDVVFQRFKPSWEIGFSAKNNNDAVKHSRLGRALDFGEQWVGAPCSQQYWDDIKPIFDYLEDAIRANKTWDDLGVDKIDKVYRLEIM